MPIHYNIVLQMPFSPYTQDTHLDLNTIEGFVTCDQTDVKAKNECLQRHPKYVSVIPSNGTPPLLTADEMVANSKQTSESSNYVYILGTIAAASLAILAMNL
jgi:hypothetical protein